LTLGLSLPSNLRACLDETELLRLDSISLGEYLGGLVQRGILSPDEARAKLGYGPIEGGQFAYMQQQNWPLQALSDPARGPASAAPALPPPAKRIRERTVVTAYDDLGRVLEYIREPIDGDA
jgi:hypothetical protein